MERNLCETSACSVSILAHGILVREPRGLISIASTKGLMVGMNGLDPRPFNFQQATPVNGVKIFFRGIDPSEAFFAPQNVRIHSQML
jgi:hypothetical protein